MMGRTHALSGWCIGLATAPVVGLTSIGDALLYATVTTGAALLPDFDHPNARATKFLGRITGAVSKRLRGLSRFAYNHTASVHDSNRRDAHRTLTHTIAFAIVLGLIVGGCASAFDWPVTLGIVVFLIALGSDALGRWMLLVAAAGAIGWAIGDEGLSGVSWRLGVAVTIGCVTHILGDWVTEAPVPMLWPIPINGRRWYPTHAPEYLRFPVDGWIEHKIVWRLFKVLAVALIPGVLPLVIGAVGALSQVGSSS
ncbi:metal-dependent hydrolase [Amycolatopsis sp. DSM 110486]|uniref:metal-dependent hydrolase n=1 Tax=Amycolatopsis sp. DSM 110486 TaxID=2865832 RepID=UPI001C6A75E6|nr:metal-dependent hydrolase [Amycolatopsis sp. DSM 110486]QYN17562.1 metal-dependent hydrolase [Amycolatopsis sp. DSM 110486]